MLIKRRCGEDYNYETVEIETQSSGIACISIGSETARMTVDDVRWLKTAIDVILEHPNL